MISYYKIPDNYKYVENIKAIESWEKLYSIDPHIPTVAIIEDSKATHYSRFVVIYKGMMQMQGGSGCCYNPIYKEQNFDPVNSNTMPAHMSKWTLYSYHKLLHLVISIKYQLLEKMGLRPELPFWYWESEYYNTIPGILIGKLDLIGMRVLPTSSIKKINKPLLALNC